MPGRWLYADLDESDPRKLTQLPPTVAWETSRGRFQALWRLDASVPPQELADLNQRVTYFTEADKGGWSLTKVLRVPGSISTKHGDDFRVRLMWWRPRVIYSPESVQKLTKKVRTPQSGAPSHLGSIKLPKASPERILKRFPEVPARARKAFRATEARGDRSERLWMLYGDLLGAGMKPEQVLHVVRATVWNKYAGQKRELRQLWTEIHKAKASIEETGKSSSAAKSSSSTGKKKSSRSRTNKVRSTSTKNSDRESSSERMKHLDAGMESYDSFLSRKLKKPGWMVASIWAEGAHGVLAGEAKTYKSVISTDLAISVASGTPFLNHFEIPSTGQVLMIQEENDPGEFQDRMYRIANSRGLLGSVEFEKKNGEMKMIPNATLPIHVMNNLGFDLTSLEDLKWLDKQCKKHRLALIILDPFYLMTPGIDENSASQVGPILRNLLKIKEANKVGIQLIHHYRKQNVQNPTHGAARMSGTGVFHRWFESAVYVEKMTEPETVKLVPDHRGHAGQPAMKATFDLGEHDDLDYHVTLDLAKTDRAALHARLDRLMREQEEWTIGELRIAMKMSGVKDLHEMIKEHGYVAEQQRRGGRGRPPVIVRHKKARGKRRPDAGL